ncbi:unnamed protein product [Medioppia subpectinata]|uniref:Nose resistant-to-fluoxetine protein N-terminal domain-containing protein n=1 Tax=Medioppia subpectinata TaxID=1979941 RepID=A0A7R9KTM6_9ACAR|nr:unnamed protein product [Medioppia subpectinata]CAG2109515.1 unnamed protein product [Medioppia subpectinata]
MVFDSMGGIPSGLSDGVITSFGDYDQCLAVKSGPQMNTKTIYGKYCLGLSDGVITSFGDYDQCLAVKSAVFNPIIRIPIEVGSNCDTIIDKIEWNLFNIAILRPIAYRGSDAIVCLYMAFRGNSLYSDGGHRSGRL